MMSCVDFQCCQLGAPACVADLDLERSLHTSGSGGRLYVVLYSKTRTGLPLDQSEHQQRGRVNVRLGKP